MSAKLFTAPPKVLAVLGALRALEVNGDIRFDESGAWALVVPSAAGEVVARFADYQIDYVFLLSVAGVTTPVFGARSLLFAILGVVREPKAARQIL